MKKLYIAAALVLVTLILPQQAQAVRIGNIFDPLCLFAWRDGCKDNITVDNSINDSFNINSNVNSPGGVVTGNTNNTNTGGNDNNNYYDDLYVSCYSDVSYADTDERVRWYASVSGGTGSYSYDWSGSEGLDGNSSSVSISYDDPGTKSANVRVSSGGKSISRSCGTVYIQNDRDYYYDDYNYNYYDRPSVSCYPETTYGNTYDRVIWRAYANGGNGTYSYSWSGTDGLSGRSESISKTYNRSGTKSASVTVRSAGRSASASCGSIVIGGDYNYNYAPVYAPVVPTTLYATCAPNVSSTRVGSVVTWTVYPTGGNGIYSYIWSGSDGFSGSQKSVVTSYRSTGPKYATVSVYSAGKTTTISCGTVNISTAAKTVIKKPTTVKPAPEPVAETPDSNFNIFDNVPWTFVFICISIIIFCTVMYLIAKASK